MNPGDQYGLIMESVVSLATRFATARRARKLTPALRREIAGHLQRERRELERLTGRKLESITIDNG